MIAPAAPDVATAVAARAAPVAAAATDAAAAAAAAFTIASFCAWLFATEVGTLVDTADVTTADAAAGADKDEEGER